MPNSPQPKTTFQSTDVYEFAELDGKQAPPELSSDILENVSTPTHMLELAESATNSDPENLQFSETLEKYLT